MVACGLRLVLLWGIGLAGTGQVAPAHSSATAAAPRTESHRVAEKAVAVEHLEVYGRADDASYRMGTLNRGERVRIRKVLPSGWVGIDPPPMAMAWVPKSSVRLDGAAGADGSPVSGRVAASGVVVRSGHLRARLPGPPWVRIPRGAVVRLVDRPPLTTGQGAAASVWFAIVPPEGALCYVRSDGLEAVTPPSPPIAERRAAYLPGEDDRAGVERIPIGAVPADIGAEIRRIDGMYRSILVNQPIEEWRFDTIRAGYQAVLKRAGADRAVEEALRVRLARVTRHEQAARAARTIQTTLADSRRRDAQVAQTRQHLAAADRARTHTYNAIGFIQPSAREVDGRKLHALIGSSGATIAYLDIPAGIDVNALGVQRVGVLGVTHYNQELGARLITVRDLEAIESRR
jgi:hypothetical protein